MNRNNDLSAEKLAIYEEHCRLTDEHNAFRLRCANFIKEVAKANGVKKNTWNGTKYVYKVEGFDLPYPLIRYNVLSITADHKFIHILKRIVRISARSMTLRIMNLSQL